MKLPYPRRFLCLGFGCTCPPPRRRRGQAAHRAPTWSSLSDSCVESIKRSKQRQKQIACLGPLLIWQGVCRTGYCYGSTVIPQYITYATHTMVYYSSLFLCLMNMTTDHDNDQYDNDWSCPLCYVSHQSAHLWWNSTTLSLVWLIMRKGAEPSW